MGEVVTPRVCDPQSEEALDTLVHQASASAGWTERNARYLLDKVDEIIEAKTWPRRLRGEPRSWQRFCAEVLGYDAAYIEHIRRGVCILQARGIHSPTVGDALTAVQVAAALEEAAQRGPGNATGRNQHGRGNVDSIHVSSPGRPTGTSRARALRRLRQQRPELHGRTITTGTRPASSSTRSHGSVTGPMRTKPWEPWVAHQRIEKLSRACRTPTSRQPYLACTS